MLSFLSNISGKTESIDVTCNRILKTNISQNREKLVPITDTVILCGWLGIPLQRHRDDSKYHPDIGQYSDDRVGNFVELLYYWVSL